jgi:hypothetical protein
VSESRIKPGRKIQKYNGKEKESKRHSTSSFFFHHRISLFVNILPLSEKLNSSSLDIEEFWNDRD